jgi:hypothetical protein
MGRIVDMVLSQAHEACGPTPGSERKRLCNDRLKGLKSSEFLIRR